MLSGSLLVGQFLLVVITAFLGYESLIKDFRTKSGSLNKKGNALRIVFFVSAGLSIGLFALQGMQSMQDASEAAERLHGISSNLQRTLERQEENIKSTKEASEKISRVADSMDKSLSQQENLRKGTESLLVRTETIQDKQSTTLAKQKELFVKQDVIMNNLTGGDSFCYVRPVIYGDKLVLVLYSKGQFPIYDIQIDLVDFYEGESPLGTYEQSTISTTLAKPLTNISLEKAMRKGFELTIRTRYAVFREDLRLVKVEERWTSAYRVEKTEVVGSEKISTVSELPRKPRQKIGDEINVPVLGRQFLDLILVPGVLRQPKFLLIEIDYDFPVNESGYVDWYG